jgi:predicted acylesterase/phospholipase RssA
MEWKPEIIVLGPGGVKGFCELGGLLYIEKLGWLENVNTYVGVSVGSVIGLLLTAGYSTTEVIEKSLDINLFHDFMSIDINQIRENSGLVSNKQVKERLEERMKNKFGIIPNMKELYQFTGIKFVSVTLNIDKCEVEYVNYETEPDLSCVEAVMLSMNIPFIFYKIKYKGCTYVDGALGNPYPVDVFDDGKTNILGIYIDDGKMNKEGFSEYVYHILHSLTNRLKQVSVKNLSPCVKTLNIVSPIFDIIGVNMDIDKKSEMIVVGHETAKAFVDELKQNTQKNKNN